MGIADAIYRSSPVAVQVALLNAKAVELHLERYGRKFRKLASEFDRNQWLSDAELVGYQEERLRGIIAHAYREVPYYRRIMNARSLTPSDIRSVEDLHKLPVLTKQVIKENYQELLAPRIRGRARRHGHTSGTTGSPLDVCYDLRTCVVHHVADWRQKNWAGLKYGQPYASMQGRLIVPVEQQKPPFWRKNYVNNQLFMSAFHLKEKNLGHYFDKLDSDGIKYMEGYPSFVSILAMYLTKQGRTFPMKAVLTSSETLLPTQRDLIESAFQCKVYDFYGMAERAVFATECDAHSGHHLNSDYGITEFLGDDLEPVARGSVGRLVATSIHNHAMPLIRYQTNDCCALKMGGCACGRGFPLMDDVATKDEAIVSLPDGRLIPPSVLTHPFKPMKNIVASQIEQIELNRLVVRVVRGIHYSKQDELLLLAGFKERLGDNIHIILEYMDEIPRTPSGKFKWVISRVKPKL